MKFVDVVSGKIKFLLVSRNVHTVGIVKSHLKFKDVIFKSGWWKMEWHKDDYDVTASRKSGKKN